MKKILFLLLLVVMSFGSASAQTDGVAIIAQSTYDAATSTDQVYNFTNGFKLNMGGRAWKTTEKYPEGINFKLNGAYSIVIPNGVKVYRIDISGFSSGDNWVYLYGWGSGDNNGYEWTDPIGNGVKDNTIIKTAKYPIDPCSGDPNYLSEKTDPSIPFAILDFGDLPYEGEFPFLVSGNNQYFAAFKIYTTREAADNAGTGTGISSIVADKAGNGIRYNIAGQRVDSNYKGIVIENGRKKIVK